MEDSMSLIICVFILVICLIFLFQYNIYEYWTLHGFEQIKPRFFFGNLVPYFFRDQDLGTLLRNCYRKSNAPIVGLYLMHKPALLLRDPQIIHRFLDTDFEHFETRHLYSNREKCPLLSNLYQFSGKLWERQRKPMETAFTTANIHNLYGTVVGETGLERYLDRLMERGGAAIEVYKLLERHLYNLMGSLVYGTKIDAVAYPKVNFRMKGKEVFQQNVWDKISFVRNFIVSEKWEWCLNFRQHSQEVEGFYIALTDLELENREHYKGRWNAKNDIMQYLMKLRNRGYLFENEALHQIQVSQGGRKFASVSEISSLAFLTFTSGFPGILSTLSFFLLEMAKNRMIQDKLSHEIEEMYLRHDMETDYSDIAELSYLDCCLNETLRKYPPVPFLVRYCTKDYKMPRSNYVIKKRMPIFISVFGMHHDPTIYPNPMLFDPDRFTSDEIRRRPNHSFMPFGDGPKNCLGMELAKAILKIQIVFFLSSYDVSMGPNRGGNYIDFDVGYLRKAKGINLWFFPRYNRTPKRASTTE